MPSIRPFTASVSVDWVTASQATAPISVSYVAPAVHTEFRRFLFRDLQAFAVAVIYCLGGWVALFNVLGVAENDAEREYLLPVLAVHNPLITVAVIFELFAHYGWDLTPANARAREVSAVVVAVLCMSGNYQFHVTDLACAPDGIDLGIPVDNVSDPSVYDRYCGSRVSAYPFAALVLGAGVIRHGTPFHSLILCVFGIVCTFLGRLLTPDSETPAEIAAKVLLHVGCAIVVVMQAALSHREAMERFEAAVLVEAAAAEALQRS